jgi:hypothetical protein
MRRLLWVLGVVIPATIFAHGLPPQTLSVSLRPGSENDLMIGTTFGGVISHDRGQSFRVICEEAIGYGTGQRASWWLSPSGADFACSLKGLFVARTGGCDWQSVPELESIGCLEIRGQGSTLIAVSGKFGETNQILRSTDDGVSWHPSNESSTTRFYSSVRFAPSDPQRVYVGAWWFNPYASVLLRSDDNGQTFGATDLSASLPTAGAFFVLAVHPQKSSVVFASVSQDNPRAAWLVRSTDSGGSFTVVATSTEIFNSVAFGVDPSTVFAAAGNQLFRSENEGLSFMALPIPQRNACVTTTPAGRLYSCGLEELDGWVVGEASSAGGTNFAPFLTWGQIAGPISCPVGSAVATLCEPLWPVVLASFPVRVDAGPLPDAGPGTPPLPKPGCGCATVDGPLWFGLVALLLRRVQSACYIRRRSDALRR